MYDSIIIGGGIAGLTAALYSARAGLKIMLIESNVLGGQIINASSIENYPGFLNISGKNLIDNLRNQIENFDVEILYDKVINITENSVQTNNNIYKTKTIIIASGLKRRMLNIPNEKELIGSGISYCATCDGNFFKGKEVAVIGGGNTALEDTLYLSNITKKVYLIHRRSTFRGDKVLINKVSNIPNVELILESNIKSINGKNLLESIDLTNGKNIKINGLFIAIGSIPDTIVFSNIINLDENGYIISDDTTTNIKNIFVAGDVRTKNLRQITTAASDGAIAAYNVINYLK